MLAGRLKAPEDALLASLDGNLSPRHTLLLAELRAHVRHLEERLAKLDAYLIDAMAPYAWAFRLLQTLPGLARELDFDARGIAYDVAVGDQLAACHRYSGTEFLAAIDSCHHDFQYARPPACPSGAAAWLGAIAAPTSIRGRSNATTGDFDINAIRIHVRFHQLSAKNCKDARAIPTNEQTLAHPCQVPVRIRVFLNE